MTSTVGEAHAAAICARSQFLRRHRRLRLDRRRDRKEERAGPRAFRRRRVLTETELPMAQPRMPRGARTAEAETAAAVRDSTPTPSFHRRPHSEVSEEVKHSRAPDGATKVTVPEARSTW